MLNDERPRPEDLPEQPQGYAAGLGPFDAPPPAPVGSGSPGRAGGAPGPGRGRAVLAAVVVVALLAVVGLVAWQTTRPSVPVAGPAGSGSTSSGTPTTPSSGTASTGPQDDTYPQALAAFYTQSVDWKPCEGSPKHQCGTVEVPVDYSKPKGDRFTLALRKVPALDQAHKVGSLLLNPGGPGVSGLEYAQYSAFLFSKDVRQVYDIIGFDPRGIGASDAVDCLKDSDMDLLLADDPSPDTSAERTKLLSDANAITKSCAVRGGERALHMSTTEVARDMDVIRSLVGDAKLNYMGVSYGTLLGSLYADLFPDKVGRMVLDSALSPNQTDAEKTAYDIQGFESSIGAFIDWCLPRDDCALGHDKAGARERIAALLDTIDRRPLTTTRGGLTSIGEGWVGFAIVMCLYSDSSWPTLNKGLAQAFGGKGDILLAYAMTVVGRDASGHYDSSTYLQAVIPVRCADWPRSSAAEMQGLQRQAARKDPLWARLTGDLFDNCATWPGAPRKPSGTTLAKGAGPILVIGNLRDPATPIGGTKQLAKDLASGILVTSDHDGHGTYYAGNSCVDSIVDRYLIKGKAPSHDTAC